MTGRLRSLRRAAVAAVIAPCAYLALAAGDNAPVIVSLDADGDALDGNTFECSVSGNGKVAAFRTAVQGVTPNGNTGFDSIYVRDLKKGTTTLASAVDGVSFQGDCYNPNLSANGRTVLFQSYHAALGEGGGSGLYLRDVKSGRLRLVSRNAAGDAQTNHVFLDGNALSANGRFGVAYSTATNLATEAVSGSFFQVLLFDFKKRTVTLVSKGTGGGEADGDCIRPSISANGKWVTFESRATNLVAGSSNDYSQIYRYDVKTKTLLHVSTVGIGGPANGDCEGSAVSSTGVVVYSSLANNLLGMADAYWDVFYADPAHGVSSYLSEDSAEGEAEGDARGCSISQNGSLVVFSTTQSLDSRDDNSVNDIYAVDLKAGELRLVTRGGANDSGNGESLVRAGYLAGNGKWLVYTSQATNLAESDGNGSNQDAVVVDARK